jgi:hypothetical protein
MSHHQTAVVPVRISEKQPELTPDNKKEKITFDLFDQKLQNVETQIFPTPSIFTTFGRPKPSHVFDTFWRFACRRQDLYFNKLSSPQSGCWTDDPVLRKHKFTNVYRAADRVSQFLIQNVIYTGSVSVEATEEVFFRILLFKTFNKIETWQLLERDVGPIHWATYDFACYDQVLSRAIESGRKIYSAAYIMPSGRSAFGYDRKHRNHLKLLEKMMVDGLPHRLVDATLGLGRAFEMVRQYPGIGNFLAYQYAIDLNYSPILSASEDDFVMPGPGALDGIAKCFLDLGDYSPADAIRFTRDQQHDAFERLGLQFKDLWGRPLHLIDVQNLFCEVDKYARIMHPEVRGRSARTRIKQIYKPTPGDISPWFPPKWGINARVAAETGSVDHGACV